jgi:aryl-alcohol dehydrogenase-like predicted oxidoreductase
MEKRTLGKTGMEVTALGYGGAEIGYEKADQATVEALLNAALDAGLNMIDTAECYLASEEMIGHAVAGRRREFLLFTKVGHRLGLPGADWDPDLMTRSIDRSLQRLQTDCIDLIQLHSCSAEQLREGAVIEVLIRAREAGKTRFIGYSGDNEAARYAVESGSFDTLQTSASIADQWSIENSIPFAQAKGMGVIAKRPIANAAWKTGLKPENDYHRTYWERLRKLGYPFLEGGGDEAVGVALRFALAIPGVHTAIVGTKNPARWKQNAALLDSGPLPTEMYDLIRKLWSDRAEPGWKGER